MAKAINLLMLPDNVILKICSYMTGQTLLQFVQVHIDLLNICNSNNVWLEACCKANLELTYNTQYDHFLTNLEKSIVGSFGSAASGWQACTNMKCYMFWLEARRNLENNLIMLRGVETTVYHFIDFSAGFLLEVSREGACELWNLSVESTCFRLPDFDNNVVQSLVFSFPLLLISVKTKHYTSSSCSEQYEVKIYKMNDKFHELPMVNLYQTFSFLNLTELIFCDDILISKCNHSIDLWNVRTGYKVLSFNEDPITTNYVIDKIMLTKSYICCSLNPKLDFFSIAFQVYQVKDFKVKLFFSLKGNAQAYINNDALFIKSLTNNDHYLFSLSGKLPESKCITHSNIEFLSLSSVLILQDLDDYSILVYSLNGILKYNFIQNLGICLTAAYCQTFLLYATSDHFCIADLNSDMLVKCVKLHVESSDILKYHVISRSKCFNNIFIFWKEIIYDKGAQHVMKFINLAPRSSYLNKY